MHLSLAPLSANKFLTEMISVSTGETACTIRTFNAGLGKGSGYANVMGMNDEEESPLDLCTGKNE
jgi:hypothetical protein